eukprot:481885_1
MNHKLNNVQSEFLIKLLQNIMMHPNNKKYQDLSLSRIQKRFPNCAVLVDILLIAGFFKSDDGKRLFYNSTHFNKLQSIYTQLSANNDQKKTNSNIKSIQTQHLLNPQLNTKCHLGLQCPCLQMISNILKQYDLCIVNNYDIMENNKKGIYDIMENNYNNIDLLNDFNHLLSSHSHDFEAIYDELNKNIYEENGCNVLKCKQMKRHRRNRSQNALKKLYLNNNIVEQILDRIHCFYFHCEHKIISNEIKVVLRNVEDDNHDIIMFNISKLIKSKKVTSTKLKFMTKERSDLERYSYGWRFFYWVYYRNDKR